MYFKKSSQGERQPRTQGISRTQGIERERERERECVSIHIHANIEYQIKHFFLCIKFLPI